MSHPMFDVGIEINGLKAEIESLCDRLSFAEFEWHRATDGMKERDAEIETLRVQLASAHDACLTLCGNHSFATGHGDTVADIIGEIDGQIGKRTEQLASASRALEPFAAVAKHITPQCPDNYELLPLHAITVKHFRDAKLALSDELRETAAATIAVAGAGETNATQPTGSQISLKTERGTV